MSSQIKIALIDDEQLILEGVKCCCLMKKYIGLPYC
jgi:YesN/AraC family two-component response regulator